MNEYHKIDSIFKRDMESPQKRLIVGDYSRDWFAYLANNEWVFTEKVDGTNIRVIITPGSIEFGGRTDNAMIPAPLVKRLQERFTEQAGGLHEAFPDGGVLYGEGYGGKIQKGGNYRPDQDFVLFDVNVGGWWLQRADVEDVAHKFGIDFVPIVGRGSLAVAVEMATAGFKSRWGDFTAEGIVARPSVELKSRGGHRIIAKIKHRDFAP